MKHIFKFSLLLLALLLPATALAHDFEVDGIYYNINGNEATVTYFNDYTGSVTIPPTVTYNGTTYSVTSIGEGAFYECSGLTSIDIPSSVTAIGNAAFYGCSSLTSINIPNSVIFIRDHTFYHCSGLTSITIPNSVTSIGHEAFEYCSGLTSITIPNSVTSIGNSAFNGCSGLTRVTIPNSVISIRYSTFSGCSGLTSIDIPNSVTSIGDNAFEDCSGLTSITIPNSVISIGYFAFSGCSGLTSITIPNSVTSIGEQAFSSCSGLTSIEIPNSVTTISNYAFSGCSGLTSVIIPNSVASIGRGAFSGCSSLTSIDIPNSVSSIGGWVFYGCSGLTSVTIGNSVTSIGDGAFENCNGITDLIWNAHNCSSKGWMPSSNIERVTIGNEVEILPFRFVYNSKITTITIPNSVTSIGVEAFIGCSGLTSIQVANNNPTYDSRGNCNAIIETATNTLIVGCMNTTIPNSVASIGNEAFSGCSSLTSIDIPNSVTTIGYDAFLGCNRLTSITIPNSVTAIGAAAFSGCSGLSEIYSLALVPPTVYSSTFNGCYEALLLVPVEAYEVYKQAEYWKLFNIACIGAVTPGTIFEVDGIYYRTTTMNSASVIANNDEGILYNGDVVIPDSVTYEGYTFAVTGIEGNAFDGCYELTSIAIPNSVETICEQAFQGCTGLKSVTIGSGVTAIGAKAFNYCNALETVKCIGTIPPEMASADCFSTAAYNRATLLVPRNTETTYAATDYWYKFARIDGWGSAGRGDVNGDGVMSILDVVSLIDVLLGNELDSFYFDSADLNSNGRIDIGDVASLIDNLLNGDY